MSACQFPYVLLSFFFFLFFLLFPFFFFYITLETQSKRVQQRVYREGEGKNDTPFFISISNFAYKFDLSLCANFTKFCLVSTNETTWTFPSVSKLTFIQLCTILLNFLEIFPIHVSSSGPIILLYARAQYFVERTGHLSLRNPFHVSCIFEYQSIEIWNDIGTWRFRNTRDPAFTKRRSETRQRRSIIFSAFITWPQLTYIYILDLCRISVE